jgi:predicted outer membrane repeat protein
METGGGAIFVAAGSALVVRDSVFSGNRGTQGGAINSLLSSLTVENSQFINNSTAGGAVGYGYGGAIYTDGASEHPDDAIGGQIRIAKTVFRGNVAAGQGGAVQAWVYPPDQVFVSDSTFESNQVIPRPGGEAFGGALRLGNGRMTIANTTFANNLARNQGGAVWIGGNTAVSSTTLR